VLDPSVGSSVIRTEHTTANFNVGTVVYPEIQSIGQQASPIDRKAKKVAKIQKLSGGWLKFFKL
jgi:hypothetical protein